MTNLGFHCDVENNPLILGGSSGIRASIFARFDPKLDKAEMTGVRQLGPVKGQGRSDFGGLRQVRRAVEARRLARNSEDEVVFLQTGGKNIQQRHGISQTVINHDVIPDLRQMGILQVAIVRNGAEI